MSTTAQLRCSSTLAIAQAHSTISDNRRNLKNKPNSSISFPYSKTLNRALSIGHRPIWDKRHHLSFSVCSSGSGACGGRHWSRGDENEESKPSTLLSFSSSKPAGFSGRRSTMRHSMASPLELGGLGKKSTTRVTVLTARTNEIWKLWPKTWTDVSQEFTKKDKTSCLEALRKNILQIRKSWEMQKLKGAFHYRRKDYHSGFYQ